MKKIFLGLTIIAIIFFTACSPIEDRHDIGSAITADEIEATVTVVQEDGVNVNCVKCECSSPITCKWTNGTTSQVSTSAELTMFITGEQTITLKGLCADGTQISKEFTVQIDSISKNYPVAPEWGYLCGSGKKTWVWDDTQPSEGQNSGTDGPVVYGTGGYLGCSAPCWWNVSLPDVDGVFAGEGDGASMLFSLTGDNGAELTKNYSTGSSETGNFTIDMDDMVSEGWDIGTLSTNGITILAGSEYSDYSILSLNEDYMSLSAAPSGTGSWGQANFWMFKASE